MLLIKSIATITYYLLIKKIDILSKNITELRKGNLKELQLTN